RVLGSFAEHGRFVVRHRGRVVADVPNQLITAGISVRRPAERRAAAPPVALPEGPPGGPLSDPAALLGRWAGSRRGASRRPVTRFYDSEVQGRAVLRPGEADAGVFLLRWGGPEAVAVAMDGDPGRMEADPRGGAAAAVCEVCRNLAAVGAVPLALTDCLNFGNPEHPEVMGDLEAALEGLGEAARAVGVPGPAGGPRGEAPLPFISGNVSLYNQPGGGQDIPPSPVVAGVGVLEDLGRATTPRLKRPGHAVAFLGRRRAVFSGSWAAREAGLPARGGLPEPGLAGAQVRAEVELVRAAIAGGTVSAAHDVAEGGVLWTGFEMCLPYAGGSAAGLELTLPYAGWMLEEGCGFLLELEVPAVAELERRAQAAGLEAFAVGRTVAERGLRIRVGGGWRTADLEALAAARGRALEDIFP
ncbi:MAG TPA: AIR synthase related protein, partial [Candidatus Saccharimonadales bacterium]|nr:AIR synthase related protein [Candidatus Saccharimonadales bacterium]